MPFYEDKNPLAKNYYENPELKYVKRKEENLYENPELKYHRVTGNESIGTIAGMYGVTPQALVGANPSMQGAPPAGSFVAVPRILQTQGANSFSGAQLAPPQPQFPQKDELPPAFNPSPVALALSAVPFVLPGLWERQNVPIGSFQSGSGGVNQPDSNAGMKAYYESNKPPTVEAATKAATAPVYGNLEELREERNKKYTIANNTIERIVLAAQDLDITSQFETGLLPTSIPGGAIPYMTAMMEQRAQSGQPYVDMALITAPVSQGGMGGVWNWTTQSFDLPSTAPGAKLTPGMALNSQWELFKNNNTVDLNVMPYFISNDELAIPGYQDEEWSNYKNLRKLGGVPSDGGWVFPKSNNAPDNPLYPSPSPSGGGGNPIPKPKRGRGGGGGGGGGGVVPSTNANANAVPLNPENQKIFDKVMTREVDSETAIKQLEWFLSSGYLSPDQQILAQQELERLRIAKRLAMLSSYKTASNIWRIG